MMLRLPDRATAVTCLLILAVVPVSAVAEVIPGTTGPDSRIRVADYDPGQVYVLRGRGWGIRSTCSSILRKRSWALRPVIWRGSRSWHRVIICF